MLNFWATTVGAGVVRGLFEQDCTLCGGRSRDLVCAACDGTLPRSHVACENCALPLPQAGRCGGCLAAPPAFDAAIAAFDYRFPVDRIVQRFKYSGDLALGRWLGERLSQRLQPEQRPALIICPPSTTARLRKRGFNPALEIAKVVARSLGTKCAMQGLQRSRDTEPQPGLGRAARRRNLEGAFVSAIGVDGLHVALVDDVMTTGATAEAAARVLKRAGAARVSVWVAARTPEPGGLQGGPPDV